MFNPLKKTILVGLCSAAVMSFHANAVAQQEKREDREPEAATGVTQKQAVKASQFMVAAANPYASEAAFNMLEKGGSAVDAAIATQLVLTLVEPQSSGIGGGAFMLHWQKDNKQLVTYDGRETAPAAATADLFLDKNGKPVKWIDAVVGGRSVGVPGVMAMLKQAHDKHGKLPWAVLFEDAIKLAEQGFVVSPRLEKLVSMKFNPGLIELPASAKYFYPNGQPLKAGQVLVNKPLAKVYRSMAKEGIAPFYQGWIAQDIVAAVKHSPIAPGRLALKDMADYQPKQRDAICGPYREFNVCGMAPPSSGGIAVVQMLGILQHFEMNDKAINSVEALHLFTQSSRLAFADRDFYVADPDFTDIPTEQMLAKDYLTSRAGLISQQKDMGKAIPGTFNKLDNVASISHGLPSTSHFSIVDADGNAVSMTTSIEMAFGSGVFVNGFLLNNQLTDFSLVPSYQGKLVANRVEPLKRPRSSMAPMMVFDNNNQLAVVAGSPGGSRIINYVAHALVGMLDWQLDPQQAINLPRITNRNRVTTLEKGTALAQQKEAFEKLGHQVQVRDLNSGIHAIQITKQGLVGGADERREGLVLGK